MVECARLHTKDEPNGFLLVKRPQFSETELRFLKVAADFVTLTRKAPSGAWFGVSLKRTGGKRKIAQPAREVKALQRILARKLAELPIHNAATAYRTGLSIRDNAARHAAGGPIMKFDFQAFFPSIRGDDWERYCIANGVFKEFGDIALSTRLFFHRLPGSSLLTLAIGAPSSPWLSNVLMYEFDCRISQAVEGDQVIYTRYADDLTFSAPRTGFLNAVEKNLRRSLREIEYPRLSLNEAKTVVATKKYRRVVTGLVLANDGRVTLGRERKRIFGLR